MRYTMYVLDCRKKLIPCSFEYQIGVYKNPVCADLLRPRFMALTAFYTTPLTTPTHSRDDPWTEHVEKFKIKVDQRDEMELRQLILAAPINRLIL